MLNKMPEDFKEELLLADALLRLAVIERLLISKGFITKEEFKEETSKISDQIIQMFLKTVTSKTDLNKVAENLKSSTEK